MEVVEEGAEASPGKGGSSGEVEAGAEAAGAAGDSGKGGGADVVAELAALDPWSGKGGRGGMSWAITRDAIEAKTRKVQKGFMRAGSWTGMFKEPSF